MWAVDANVIVTIIRKQIGYEFQKPFVLQTLHDRAKVVMNHVCTNKIDEHKEETSSNLLMPTKVDVKRAHEPFARGGRKASVCIDHARR